MGAGIKTMAQANESKYRSLGALSVCHTAVFAIDAIIEPATLCGKLLVSSGMDFTSGNRPPDGS
jgi:hypothetical protein